LIIAGRLEQVRERTLGLVAGLDWQILQPQHIPILSPIVWDLGHIANFEELWLCQGLGDLEPLEAEFATMFDAVLNPRPTRQNLPLPVARRLWDYLSRVRTRALEVLEGVSSEDQVPLLDRGFVYEMVAEHEEQHQETILQLLQVMDSPTYLPAQRRRLPSGRPLPGGMVLIPGGSFRMGNQRQGFAYDNELAAHDLTLPPYRIDRAPVSCGQYLGFIEDGGYEKEDLWSAAGWAWRQETGVTEPGNWSRREGTWQVRHMDRIEPLREDLPVIHIGFYEAEAYAHWAGKRLPSEAEWEKAALWDCEADCARLYPWGDDPPDRRRANVDQLAFQPAPIGSYPAGASAYGVEQLVGDVWEWTCSDFHSYPGFQAFPYPEYSEIFFGSEYKVLRGGSWATRGSVARGTFRNWDYPIRRQIFAGFRCAQDAE
jgi:iron(II)-dependent oxidoreductase